MSPDARHRVQYRAPHRTRHRARHRARHRVLHAAAAALALLGACAAVRVDGARAAAGLDGAERDVAVRAAAALPWSASRGRVAAGAPTHPLGVQTLVVELDERKAKAGSSAGSHAGPGDGSGDRTARVYQYDHATGGARLLLVDTVTGLARDARRIDGRRLPLNAAERALARAALATTPWLLDALAAERAARGLAPLARERALDGLDAKASVHVPPDASDPCHVERCALVSLFDANGTVSTVEPVVRFVDAAVVPLDADALDTDAFDRAR